ncbi:acyl-CoA dehydrogenase [Streptomyces sp. E11-3]|uniref:acyl-CoA dehydrogenase n=1 Tax=Streptomyces sp. E11-3 TaxID=3110112 RepID=UPI00397FE619
MTTPELLTEPQEAARARADLLEERLGDPTEPDNPVGYRALLKADAQAVLSRPGEALLDDFGMHAEFVPRWLGGRLESIDSLVRVMRPVFRRDAALGMGYGTMSFMGAADVWLAGSEEQQRWLASVVLGGGRVAIAQHETAHGNDFVRSGITARRASGGFVLNGAKPMINNLERADALTLFCRTRPEPGRHSHTALLLDLEEVPETRSLVLPCNPGLGLRGCRWAGLEFQDCPAPESALLGPEGGGLRTALRSFQISRTVMSALSVGAVDTNLRTAVRFDQEHIPGSTQEAMDPRRTVSALAGAFTDLLLYDCLAVVATRAIQLLPEQTSVYSSAVKYLLPRVLSQTMYDLSIVLGSKLYERDGTIGVFQKHLRDVPVISLGHAGSAACQATIIPQLRALAWDSWLREKEAPAELFQTDAPLPPLRTDRLGVACGKDALSATLVAVADQIPRRRPVERVLAQLADVLVGELRDLRERVLALPERAQGGPAGPAAFTLTDRYTRVLAAAAVLGVWWHNRSGPDPFLADPSWAAAALHRLARALGARVPDLPRECEARIHHEVLARFGDRRSYDLYNSPVSG